MFRELYVVVQQAQIQRTNQSVGSLYLGLFQKPFKMGATATKDDQMQGSLNFALANPPQQTSWFVVLRLTVSPNRLFNTI